MSANKQTGKTISKIVAYVLVLLVVVATIGLIVRFTGGFTSDFKTFYVTVDGKDVLITSGGYLASPEKPLKVDVKYIFNSASSDASGYSVKVVPHVVEGKNFDFTLDDQVYSFQAETDLTSGFDIQREKSSFTVAPKGKVTEVLQAVYPNNTIGDCDGKSYEDMYALIVTSYNGEQSVTLYFTLPEDVSGVELDKEQIIF